jgi:hypothetical protein
VNRWTGAAGKRQEIYRGCVRGRCNDIVRADLAVREDGLRSICVKRITDGFPVSMFHIEYRNGDEGDGLVATHRDASALKPGTDGSNSNNNKTKLWRYDEETPLVHAMSDSIVTLTDHYKWQKMDTIERLGSGSPRLAKEFLPVAVCVYRLAEQICYN